MNCIDEQTRMNFIESMYEQMNELEQIRMSYIEDMYKDVGIKPCSTQNGKKQYPLFTAEKQLKIFCFIVNNRYSVLFYDKIATGGTLIPKDLQRDLAWVIHRIWHEDRTTEEERQQIKEILE